MGGPPSSAMRGASSSASPVATRRTCATSSSAATGAIAADEHHGVEGVAEQQHPPPQRAHAVAVTKEWLDDAVAAARRNPAHADLNRAQERGHVDGLREKFGRTFFDRTHRELD